MAWVLSHLAFCGEAAAGGFGLILEYDRGEEVPGKENPRESELKLGHSIMIGYLEQGRVKGVKHK